MIEASIGAVSGLVPVFCVMAVLLALPTALVTATRKRPLLLPVLLAVSLAGVLTVTLLPGNAGAAMEGLCDTGSPSRLLTSPSALLNIALFVPAALLGTLVFRRPVTVTAVAVLGSGTVELVQATGSLGRACSATDLVANATGAVAGACAAALWLRTRAPRTERALRDWSWGTGIALAGAAVLAVWFQTSVSTVDAVAAERARENQLLALDGSDAWMAEVAEEVFGPGTRTEETVTDLNGESRRITVVTNRGEITGRWPEKALERAWSSDNRIEDGDLNRAQALTIGAKFAHRWFPDSTAGSRRTLDRMGEAGTPLYVLTYRRYVDDVMMPMRLDITITATGRIMGFASKPEPDPELPPVSVSREEAMRLAKKMSGAPAEAAVLLAQRVRGTWRPVWMTSVKTATQDPNLFLDAVTGERVTPDAQPAQPGATTSPAVQDQR
ncbi:VanZ family protein [Streptomyces sp. NPDC001889]